jgi:hypothetical protein
MSLEFGAALIAILSVFVASLLCAVFAKLRLRKFWFVAMPIAVPFTLANGLYWSPV